MANGLRSPGARVEPVNVHADGTLDLEDFHACLETHQPKLVAMVHASNTLGTINPISDLCRAAADAGALTLVDGSQALPHMSIDVAHLGCDFYVATAHKAYGPTGIGFLWGKKEHLEAMPPWRGGGEMIQRVSFDGTTYNSLPHKFEAGTPHISGGIAFGIALDWMKGIGMDDIAAHEADLVAHAHSAIGTVKGVRIIGTAPHKVGVVSLVAEGIHPYDMGTLARWARHRCPHRTPLHRAAHGPSWDSSLAPCACPLRHTPPPAKSTWLWPALKGPWPCSVEPQPLPYGSNHPLIESRQQEVIEDFSVFDDWMDKYEHLIDLGKDVPAIDERAKTEEHLIKGCQSRVWLAADVTDDGAV